MEIPKYIEVKTVSGIRAAFLSPNDEENSIKDCFIDCRLNAESTLEFYIPATSEKISELTPECQIWAGGRVYSLLQPEATDTTRDEKNKLWTKVMAIERWRTELEVSFIEPSLSNDPSASPPADLAVIIVGGGTNLSGGLYQTGTAAHALYAVLKGSGWSLGICDVTGIHDLEMEKTSRLDLVKEIQNLWGGYLVWDSVNRIVHLRNSNTWQNYTGFQVRYKKNLKHITRTQSNRLVTKLYCFGHDDLDIAAANNGVKYITNHSYTPREYVGVYRNQDIYDAQELKDKAAAELSLICHPQYKYSVKMVDLRTLPEYSHEDFTVGDMVDVVDESVAPESPRVRLIRHKYNIFKPWICELEIGDPIERLVESLKAAFNNTSFINDTFRGNGQMSGYNLEDLTISNAKIKNLSADKITTGYLSADRIEAGSIGASKIKTNELIVGTNIAMGPNATISWEKVTNQPFIPQSAADIGALTTTQLTTILGQDYVVTGKIYANQIFGGVANLADSVNIGVTGSDISKKIAFSTGVTIETSKSTFGGTWGLTINAEEVFIPNLVGYASDDHSHGNYYVKSKWGQNLSWAYEEDTNTIYLRFNDKIVGSITLD